MDIVFGVDVVATLRSHYPGIIHANFITTTTHQESHSHSPTQVQQRRVAAGEVEDQGEVWGERKLGPCGWIEESIQQNFDGYLHIVGEGNSVRVARIRYGCAKRGVVVGVATRTARWCCVW